MAKPPSAEDKGNGNVGTPLYPDAIGNVEDTLFGKESETIRESVVDELAVMLDCDKCVVKMPSDQVRAGTVDTTCTTNHKGGRPK